MWRIADKKGQSHVELKCARSGFMEQIPLTVTWATSEISSVLFCSVLFRSVPFCSVLFCCFILFYSILFYSILFYSILFYSVLSSTLFYSIVCGFFYLVPFCPYYAVSQFPFHLLYVRYKQSSPLLFQTCLPYAHLLQLQNTLNVLRPHSLRLRTAAQYLFQSINSNDSQIQYVSFSLLYVLFVRSCRS